MLKLEETRIEVTQIIFQWRVSCMGRVGHFPENLVEVMTRVCNGKDKSRGTTDMITIFSRKYKVYYPSFVPE